MDDKLIKKINSNKGFYLPLFNMRGVFSSITPFFAGDFKRGYYNYVLPPISELDLYSLTKSRNVIFYIDDVRYDLNGQMIVQDKDEVLLEVSKLSQKVIRNSDIYSISTTSFIPLNDMMEIHLIKFKNKQNKKIKLKAITSIPLYSRSPENIFDHRHVTSLLNEIHIYKNGIINKPTLSFDERGHKLNEQHYGVFSFSDKSKVKSIIPTIDDYLNKGSFLNPKGIDNESFKKGDVIRGYEGIGAIKFKEVELGANDEINYSILMLVNDKLDELLNNVDEYKNFNKIEEELNEVHKFFKDLNSYISFEIENIERTKQLNWITLQPILRRYFGNSYLPHHDYGHGGKGWRDLWQDLLALIYSNDISVRETILANFRGVRIDGSNATIIGDKLGEFKADRNQIVRVWSDHGAWPLLTTKMYIDETGDIDILKEKEKYFYDKFSHYTKKIKLESISSNILKYEKKDYEGSVMEHLLLQNIVGFLNVGKKGFTKLEDADWNDGIDMAKENGETIPFTMFYLNNLRVIVDLLENLEDEKIVIFEALSKLIFGEISLTSYFDKVSDLFGLEKVEINKISIISRLNELIKEKEIHINKKALINDEVYQSYINNDNEFVDSTDKISLTAQAMALLNNIPTKRQALKLANKTKKLLFDEKIGGYRLNSNYEKVMLNLGRAFGFAYGHKENGAVFSHMAVMYIYGLYNYNLIDYGNEGIKTLLDQALKEEANVLAGIPEYFNQKGEGKYSFLTGSASWIVKLYREEIFGIKMNYGELSFKPKLRKDEFIKDMAVIETYLFNVKRKVTYYNVDNLDYDDYTIGKIKVNGVIKTKNTFKHLDGDVQIELIKK